MAQSIAGTDLATTAAATDRKVAYTVEIQWDGSTWTDESTRVFNMSGSIPLAFRGQSRSATTGGGSAQSTVTLRNEDNRFSPNNSSSPIYDDIKDGGFYLTPIRVELGFYSGSAAEVIRQFTGVVVEISESTTSKTVVLDCDDDAAKYNEEKISTQVYEDVEVDSFMGTLCDLIGVESGDRSFDNAITRIPWAWCDDENVMNELQTCAQADGGMVYWSKEGVFLFESAYHWVDGSDHTSSQYTFITSQFEDLQPEIAPTEAYGSVIVEYQTFDEGGAVVLYALDTPFVVSPSSTEELQARFRYPSPDVSDPVAETDYVAITHGGRRIKSTSGSEPTYLSDDISVSGTKYGQRADLKITNANTDYALCLHKFQLRGIALYGAPSDQVSLSTTGNYAQSERTLKVEDNFFIQRKSQAKMLCQLYRDRLERPLEVFRIRSVPAIPWLEPGDRITIQESNSGISKDAYIINIDWSFNGRIYLFDELVSIATDYFFPVSSYFRSGTHLLAPDESQKTSNSALALTDSGYQSYLAGEFSASSATIRSIELNLKRVGSPGGRIRIKVYTQSGAAPGSAESDGTSKWVNTSDINTVSNWVPFVLEDEPALSGTYYIVLESDEDYTYDASLYWIQWNLLHGGSKFFLSSDGSTWTPHNYTPTYKTFEYPLFY